MILLFHGNILDLAQEIKGFCEQPEGGCVREFLRDTFEMYKAPHVENLLKADYFEAYYEHEQNISQAGERLSAIDGGLSHG